MLKQIQSLKAEEVEQQPGASGRRRGRNAQRIAVFGCGLTDSGLKAKLTGIYIYNIGVDFRGQMNKRNPFIRDVK